MQPVRSVVSHSHYIIAPHLPHSQRIEFVVYYATLQLPASPVELSLAFSFNSLPLTPTILSNKQKIYKESIVLCVVESRVKSVCGCGCYHVLLDKTEFIWNKTIIYLTLMDFSFSYYLFNQNKTTIKYETVKLLTRL
jgi:hypothetical protein